MARISGDAIAAGISATILGIALLGRPAAAAPPPPVEVCGPGYVLMESIAGTQKGARACIPQEIVADFLAYGEWKVV